jgi:hypothetical protein
MTITQPYRRTVRAFTDGKYKEGGRWGYIAHPKYAVAPEHYVRAFAIIHKDLLELFEYLEPADGNLQCYSYRVHGLLMRTCIEVEANLKAILQENNYTKGGNWNMDDYRKVENSHHLSQYQVKFPVWQGVQHTKTPFSAWAASTPTRLPWYQNYNAAKHDRHQEFAKADLSSLLDAIAGVAALLCAQFFNEDYGPGPGHLLLEGPNDGFDETVLDYYRIKLPNNWAAAECYDFDWQKLAALADPFQPYPYVP